MTAYVVARVDITDPAGYRQYQRGAVAAIAAGGGRIIAAGPATPLEGEQPDGAYGIVVEFPTEEAAQAFYRSSRYQALVPVRQAAAASTVISIVPGLPER